RIRKDFPIPPHPRCLPYAELFDADKKGVRLVTFESTQKSPTLRCQSCSFLFRSV
ncbi:unnamed protein product, partial [Closterium sp. Naga37s-1]